jgi:hypothetical protein
MGASFSEARGNVTSGPAISISSDMLTEPGGQNILITRETWYNIPQFADEKQDLSDFKCPRPACASSHIIILEIIE